MGNKQTKNKKTEANGVNIQEKCICKYYIKFVGSSGIGTKTSLIKRIKENKFVNITEDNKSNYEKIIYKKNNKEFILYLIDSEAVENDKSDINSDKEKKIIKYVSYGFSDADCIVMGYDVTNKKSFEEIQEYYNKKIKEQNTINLIYLLGNKSDLNQNIEVKEEEGKEFADKNGIKYFQISVKNNENINNFINDLKINIENLDDNSLKFYGNPSKDEYKVVFVGDSGIGAKTCLINRLIYNQFDHNVYSTNGASYYSKLIKLRNGKEFKINIWDTAGQEVYQSVVKIYVKESDCIVIGYDITKRESYENIKSFWYKLAKDEAKVDLIYLIANKIDLYDDEEVSEYEAREYAKEYNLRFFQVSCQTSYGIKEFLNDLGNQLAKK